MRQVVVTGGGTGIGLAVADEFVRAGDNVTITGRREHLLKEAAARLAAVAERSSGAAGYACFDASDPAALSAALELLPTRVTGGRTPLRAGHPRQRRRLRNPLIEARAPAAWAPGCRYDSVVGPLLCSPG